MPNVDDINNITYIVTIGDSLKNFSKAMSLNTAVSNISVIYNADIDQKAIYGPCQVPTLAGLLSF